MTNEQQSCNTSAPENTNNSCKMNINLVLLLYGQPLCDCTGGNIPDFKVIFI